jgi:hypothetical protein
MNLRVYKVREGIKKLSRLIINIKEKIKNKNEFKKIIRINQKEKIPT